MNVRHLIRATLGVAALSGALLSASGCVETRGRLYVNLGPPAPVFEARVVAPGPGYIWIEGYQRWDGGRYEWVPGHWAQPPRPRARWQAGHWARDRHGWYYVEGRWR